MELQQPATLLLNHAFVQFPKVPPLPPDDYQDRLGKRTDFWQREAKALWLVASGYTLDREIRQLIAAAEGTSHSGGAMKKLIRHLVDVGMLTGELFRLNGQRVQRLVALAPQGEEFIRRRLKWRAVETEWQRMQRLHEKGKPAEERHTLAVIAFAYYARLRGYPAGVMPAVSGFDPDAVVMEADRPVYVEVERTGGYKPGKWEQMAAAQGFVAFCGRTPRHRERLIRENDYQLDIPGRATDIKSLMNASWHAPYGPLWLESW